MNLVLEIKKQLEKNGQTLGFAESCTGGLLSSAFTSQSGISSVYLGSIISYNASVKQDVLKVTEESLKSFGEVSEPVALEMAEGAKKVLKVDWAVSVTGIAGPNGGTDEKPVGTVCFAVVGPNNEDEMSERVLIDGESRIEIQNNTVDHSIKILLDKLLKN